MNGKFYENLNNWGVGYMINQIPELAAILEGDGDGDFRFFNKSPDFLRIKLEPIDGSVWGIKGANNNPTIGISDEGVIQFCLAPYEPPIGEPEFGEWQLDRSEHDKVGSLFKYFGVKGNGKITYNSVATFNVSNALVQAMVSDQGYREWEAVKQAVNELTGVTDWVFDNVNGRVIAELTNPDSSSGYQYIYYVGGETLYDATTPEGSCQLQGIGSENTWVGAIYYDPVGDTTGDIYGKCRGTNFYNGWSMYRRFNPLYDPNNPDAFIRMYVSYSSITQKIILNAASSVEITEMMANTFIQAVKDSALNPDENKQIIKYVDILGQWEENKWQLV